MGPTQTVATPPKWGQIRPSFSLFDYGTATGTPEMHVTWGNGPYFLASGPAPMKFLEPLDVDGIGATTPGNVDQSPQLIFGQLTEGFDVIVEPQTIHGPNLSATLSIGFDNYDITVGRRNSLVQMAMVGDLRPIEVDGKQAFTFVSPTLTQDIAWQVNDATYAYLKVNDGSNSATALDLANAVTFEDLDSWTERYQPTTQEESDN